MSTFDIGVIGLGVMGTNLARNMAHKGFSVAGYDLDPAKVAGLGRFRNEGRLVSFDGLGGFFQSLEKPRKVFLMVPAGKPVDAVLAALSPHLSAGDVVMDGGNSNHHDTARRVEELAGRNVYFIGCGVSGGEEGALHGPSIMPGGNVAGWPIVQPILTAIAARAEDGTPCCAWTGAGGAGHFVKMVHNGIEYADMQLIAEAWWLLKTMAGMNEEKSADVFAQWNKGPLNSYLVEITAGVLRRKDDKTGTSLVSVILDSAGQKGTGKWTSMEGLDLSVPVPTIAEAVFARYLSALKDERMAASACYPGTLPKADDPSGFVSAVHDALLASKICSYAQGFALLRRASEAFGWELDCAAIASVWRAGCIIRAGFLRDIQLAFRAEPELNNLLVSEFFRAMVAKAVPGWRRAVGASVANGIPTPGMLSALGYFDSYRAENLPANLIQAQRDFFGAHTYERTDAGRGEFFHTAW